MTILSIIGTKGGSGKTTLAVSIASELQRRGASVLLGDVDPQGSALAWSAQATAVGAEAPTTVRLGEGFHRPGQLSKLAAQFDWTVLDTPPHAGPLMRASLGVADVALLPVSPSPVDLWALGDTLTVVEEARALRPGLHVAVVLNRTARTAVAAKTRATLAASEIPILAELGSRVAYVECFAAGQGVTRHAPTSDAAREIVGLVDSLVSLVAVGGKQDVA